MEIKSLLEKFMDSGKEVYEITQTEWIDIQKDHIVNVCKRSEEAFEMIDRVESECFHKEQVEIALKKGLYVSEEVTNDYPYIRQRVQQQLDREEERRKQIEAKPVLTKEIFDSLEKGSQIIVEGFKMTVHRKEDNQIICRKYRCKNQGVALTIGEKCNIKMGWN